MDRDKPATTGSPAQDEMPEDGQTGRDEDEESLLAWWLLHPKRLLLGLLGLLVVIQLIPVWLLQTNPSAKSYPRWDSARTAALVHQSCFDCHTNATTWPWYSRIAPSSWLVTYDVVKGRSRLNFGDWGTASAAQHGEWAGEVAEALASGDMPPSYYTLMHPQAALSAKARQDLIDGLMRSLK